MTTARTQPEVYQDWTPAAKRRLAARLKVIKPFDPYNSPLCTCPPKLTLNVYTGCGFECFYCYTSTYSWGRWGRDSARWGPRKDLLAGLEADIATLDAAQAPLARLPVELSLSSDPYPDSPRVREAELELTRQCLRRLAQAGMEILVQTKSDLVLRDLDVLDPGRTSIGLTVTTTDSTLAARMEPFAPSPERRIAALAAAARTGFTTRCRIDPLVPGVNDTTAAIGELVARLRDAGVRQVISSTFKKRWDSARRFQELFPEAAAASDAMYDKRQLQGYRYMSEELRRQKMLEVREAVHRCGMLFSCCREGFPELNDRCCDGRRMCDDRHRQHEHRARLNQHEQETENSST